VTTKPDAARQTICLTLIAPGGVSLGAYFAGAVAQLGVFLARWEEYIEKEGNESLPRIQLDVISGASAGSLTGAMLFQFIGTSYYETEGGTLDERLERWVKANFNAWCGDAVQVEQLLSHPKDSPRTSIFSASSLEKTAHEAIKDLNVKLPSEQNRLLYSCTVTSLEPKEDSLTLPGCPKVRNPNERTNGLSMKVQTRADHFGFRMRRMHTPKNTNTLAAYFNGTLFEEVSSLKNMGNGNDQDQKANLTILWSRLKWAALSSGSFPLAWNPVEFPRLQRDYFKRSSPQYMRAQYDTITYTDGGVLNNNPLNRSFEMLRNYLEISDEEPGDRNRVCFFISADPVKREACVCQDAPEPANLPKETEPHRLESVNLGSLAGSLISAMREQTFDDDVRAAIEQNNILQNQRTKLLPTLVDSTRNLADEECLSVERNFLRCLKEMIAPRARNDEHLQNWVSRLHDRALAKLDREGLTKGVSEPARKAVAAQLALIDHVHKTETRIEVQTLLVQPMDDLYSGFLEAFGGFLNKEYMVRDFIQGAEAAHRTLEDWLGDLSGLTLTPRCLARWGIVASTDSEITKVRKNDPLPPQDEAKIPQILDAAASIIPIPTKFGNGLVAMGTLVLFVGTGSLIGLTSEANLSSQARSFLVIASLASFVPTSILLLVIGGLLSTRRLSDFVRLIWRWIIKPQDRSE
jgi:predicted acylesterase/phospholipase RssA